MTTAEYFTTPESSLPTELVFGQLRTAEAPSTSHQRVVRELLLAIAQETSAHDAGEVLCAPVDVVLDFAGNLVVQPDLVFISKHRNDIVRERIYGPPDLAIEVLSPDPRIGQLDERIGWFARYGVRECWLADQKQKQIVVLTLSRRHGVVSRTAVSDSQTVVSDVLAFTEVDALRVFGY
jgi:Uma2 family endonuclease